MDSISFSLVALLFFAALIIGSLDAIAGAGGLLVVPLLLSIGLHPTAALATNKVQGAVGTASATLTFWRAGAIRWSTMWPVALVALLAGALGTLTVQHLDPSLLRHSIPVLLIAVALYMYPSSRLGEVDRPPLVPFWIFMTAVAGVALYDGLLGLGTGSLLLTLLSGLLGQNVRSATAHTKLLNFASNLGSVSFFILGGQVVWPVAIAMAAGSLIGAQLGAQAVLLRGSSLVRPIVVISALAMAARLLWHS